MSLDIAMLHEEIDKFTLKGGPESYHIDIPAQKPRGYLGMSALGHPCRRATWYDFRKVTKKSFPPRMLRLFRRGDVQEFMFIHLLKGVGFQIFDKDADGKQFKATDFEGHLSGSMDGVAKAPKKFGYDKPFLLEFKTVNDKGFQKFKADGVKKTNPKYFGQMQLYCGYNKLDAALFCAVNKNDDELFFEWVPFDKYAFRRLVESAGDILEATAPPEKISNNPAWWECKFCDFHGVCHKGEPSVKSCRSCKFSRPAIAGEWECTKGQNFGEVCSKWKDIARV